VQAGAQDHAGYSWLSGLQAHIANSQPIFGFFGFSQSIDPQSVLILDITRTQVQDLALDLVELHKVRMGPLLKAVRIPLDVIPSVKQSLLSGIFCPFPFNELFHVGLVLPTSSTCKYITILSDKSYSTQKGTKIGK